MDGTAPVSVLEFVLLVLAGLGAGLTGSIAGLASLISYPALLATGVPALTANVTNTVALVLSSVGSVTASRPELRGQRARALRLTAAAVFGGAVGAGLLLLTPSSAFEKIVPWLIAAASAAILVQRPPRELAAEGLREHGRRGHSDPWWLPAATFAVCVYGGYFGAAAGVLLLATYLLATGEGLPRSNALKNVILGVANAVAAIGYVVLSSIAWSAAIPLAIGLFGGGLLGPRIVRRAPQTALRRIIAVAGIGLAIRLGIQAYG
ncbi:MAG: putative permease [Frankiales bacterium]|nr:putative permease [Frankiales bacterium]